MMSHPGYELRYKSVKTLTFKKKLCFGKDTKEQVKAARAAEILFNYHDEVNSKLSNVVRRPCFFSTLETIHWRRQ